MYSSSLTSPDMEAKQPQPNYTIDEHHQESNNSHPNDVKQTNFMDEFDSVLGVEDEENWPHDDMYGQLDWDFMEYNSLSINGDEDGELQRAEFSAMVCEKESQISIKKEEDCDVWDDDDTRLSLNLSLNHQNVLDAWSDRGPLWADDNMLSTANNAYMGEVPVMEEERTTRREASVLRYKEKRQTRLFSKKIRYEVRKLNADKRPRIKGRFVKRVAETTLK